MRVEVYTTASAFQDLRAEWCQVLSQLPFQSVFFFPPGWEEPRVASFGPAPPIALAHRTRQRWDAPRARSLDEQQRGGGTATPRAARGPRAVRLSRYVDGASAAAGGGLRSRGV